MDFSQFSKPHQEPEVNQSKEIRFHSQFSDIIDDTFRKMYILFFFMFNITYWVIFYPLQEWRNSSLTRKKVYRTRSNVNFVPRAVCPDGGRSAKMDLALAGGFYNLIIPPEYNLSFKCGSKLSTIRSYINTCWLINTWSFIVWVFLGALLHEKKKQKRERERHSWKSPFGIYLKRFFVNRFK